MRFESPLLLLLLIPAVAIIGYGLRRLSASPAFLRFPSLDAVRRAHPSRLGRLVNLPRWLQALALILAIVALARPQLEDPAELTGEGADFVIALDMSGSMNAVDMPPERIVAMQQAGREPPNRFEAARDVLRRFIRSRDQDRIGLVIFAGKAYVKFPLTMDQEAMLRILDELVLDDRSRNAAETCANGCTITGESTAIGDALARAFKRVEASESRSRNIILITDGDNNAGTAAPEEVARFIGQQSPERPIHVYPFLVGGGEHTYMPAFHQHTGRLLRTPDGLRVYEQPDQPFPVNPELLGQVADLTGGAFFEAPTEDAFRQAFSDLEKTRFTSPTVRRYREAFLGPLGVAIALLLVGEVLAMTVWRRWP
jgi:Ca-activated chloride channel family protein